MTLILKQGASKKDIDLLEARLARRRQRRKGAKGFDAQKFKGMLKLKETPLEIQKQLRDEWERNPGRH